MMKTTAHYNQRFSVNCKTLLFTAIGAWLVSAAATVAANEVAVCGATLNGDAVMTGDLLCSEVPALELNPGATLDMQGYTLTCDHGAISEGIALNGDNQFRNGHVRDCPGAVSVNGENSYIENIDIIGPDDADFIIGFIVDEGNNSFSNNTVQLSNNAQLSKAWVIRSSGNRLADNTVIGSHKGFEEAGDAGSNTYINNSTKNADVGFDLLNTNNSWLYGNKAKKGRYRFSGR